MRIRLTGGVLACMLLVSGASSAASQADGPDPGYPFGSVADYPSAMDLRASGDFNSDRDPDLIGLRRNGAGPVIRFGRSGLQFGPPTYIDAPAEDLEVARINDDSRPDLVLANPTDVGGVTVTVLLGNGDGTFSQAGQQALSPNLLPSIAVGDMDGDGDADIVVLGTRYVASIQGDGDGGLAAPVETPIAFPDEQEGDGLPRTVRDAALATADFDLDGKDEPVFPIAIYPNLGERGPLVLLDMADDGSFSQRTTTTDPGGPTSFTVGLFDGDNRPDLAAGNAYSDVRSGGAAYVSTDSGFVQSNRIFMGSGSNFVAADFDRDGTNDLALASDQPPGDGRFFPGSGDGVFSAWLRENRFPLHTRSAPTGLVAGYFDKDRWIDVARGEAGSLLVQRNLLGDADPGSFRLRVGRYEISRRADEVADVGGRVRGFASLLTEVKVRIALSPRQLRRSGLPQRILLTGEGRWGPRGGWVDVEPSSLGVRSALKNYEGPALRPRIVAEGDQIDGWGTARVVQRIGSRIRGAGGA